jgi:predicted TPR repeat methyltransferase
VIRQLRISVEELAYNRVQALRERVVTKVADAGSLSGIVGSGLRSRVEEEIKQG